MRIVCNNLRAAHKRQPDFSLWCIPYLTRLVAPTIIVMPQVCGIASNIFGSWVGESSWLNHIIVNHINASVFELTGYELDGDSIEDIGYAQVTSCSLLHTMVVVTPGGTLGLGEGTGRQGQIWCARLRLSRRYCDDFPAAGSPITVARCVHSAYPLN